jgi:phage replication-related protein YjqB (UPF0714/DUF867 family)
MMAAINRPRRSQVRIRRTAEDVALFTVSDVVNEAKAGIVRMGGTGRGRLDGPNEFDARLEPEVPRSDLSDTRAEELNEFVERIDDDHQRALIAIAPHGGEIERHTDEQALLVADRVGVTSWLCKGFGSVGDGAVARWHITSTDISPASFPLLRSVARRRFEHAVSFHGFVGHGVVIGGQADSVKPLMLEEITRALAGEDIDVRVADPDDRLGGDDPDNIVNRLASRGTGGIQIEQGGDARTGHWEAIAEAVAAVYIDLLRQRG